MFGRAEFNIRPDIQWTHSGLLSNQPYLFAYIYIYESKFKFSTLKLEVILRFFHRCLFFGLCFWTIKNTRIKILFPNYFSFKICCFAYSVS